MAPNLIGNTFLLAETAIEQEPPKRSQIVPKEFPSFRIIQLPHFFVSTVSCHMRNLPQSAMFVKEVEY